MDEREFVTFVSRLESYSSRHPTAYKVRVALLAALVYLYLFSIVLGILLAVAAVLIYGSLNLLLLKFLLIPLGIAAAVLRSLWVTFPYPEGHELNPEDAPQLFDLVGAVRKATQGPRVHKTLLSDEFNAGIVQRPRLGMFGWQQNYLVVGLPLLKALSTDEVRAVIAHEFGHLSGNHGRFAGWIYRVRHTWIEILSTMKHDKRYGSGLFEPFFNWYAPYFSAYSFVLARGQEYEADRCAVEISGKETTARALINLELKSYFLVEQFWPGIYGQAEQEPQPPMEPFSAMLEALRQPLKPDMAQLWFSQSLTNQHDYQDTHPSLAERLLAIGYTQSLSASEAKPLGIIATAEENEGIPITTVNEEWLARRNRLWRERVTEPWRARHDYLVEASKALNALNEKAKLEQLTLDEQWEQARLFAGIQGSVAARPLFEKILEIEPDHVGARYLHGEALLEGGDDAGIRDIEFAMGRAIGTVESGCQRIYSFLKAHDRAEEADSYRKRLESHYDQVNRAQEERKTLNVGDEFRPHDLPDEVVGTIREELSHLAPLRQAFLVRKVLRYFPEERQYVLAVKGKYPFVTYRTKRSDGALVSLVASQVSFDKSILFVAIDQRPKLLRNAITGVKGAEIYYS